MKAGASGIQGQTWHGCLPSWLLSVLEDDAVRAWA